MIWFAVSVFLVCATVLLIGWRSQPYIRRAFTLAERPKPTWEHAAWRTTVANSVQTIVTALHDRPAQVFAPEPIVPLAIAERLSPLVERWLALKESELAEAHKPTPKPPEVPLLPVDLAEMANRESEDWAKEAVAKHFQELGIKFEGDWGKVRGYALTDPHG